MKGLFSGFARFEVIPPMGEDLVRELFWTAVVVGAAAVLLSLVVLRNRREWKRLPPGPKPWPIVGNLGELETNMSHQGFANMSKKYGSPLIHLWLGSVHVIVANSIEVAREVLKVQDRNFATRPKITPFVELSYDCQSISCAPHGRMWRHLRKVFVLELLTSKRVQHFQPVRVEEIKTAVRTLLQESNGEKPVQIVPKLRSHLTNTLTRMMMSESYFGPNPVGSTDFNTFQSNCSAMLKEFGVFHLGDYIRLFKYWDVQGNKKRMRAATARIDKFLQNVIDNRKNSLSFKRNTGDAELQEKGDFLDVLLTRSVDDDEIEVTETIMKGILQDTLVGGVDSTAATVEWALAELLRHPKILEKAHDELDMTVGRERLVEEEDIPKLLYIQAIVKETFRLHPVTPMLIPRLAIETCKIKGYHIPAGTHAYVNVWAVARDPELWKNPLDFNPDRFLGSPIDVLGVDFELLPFGSGRRNCPGKNLALLAVQYSLAVLIQSCDWSFLPGQSPEDFDMSEGVGIVNHKANPVEAILTRRLPKDILA